MFRTILNILAVVGLLVCPYNCAANSSSAMDQPFYGCSCGKEVCANNASESQLPGAPKSDECPSPDDRCSCACGGAVTVTSDLSLEQGFLVCGWVDSVQASGDGVSTVRLDAIGVVPIPSGRTLRILTSSFLL